MALRKVATPEDVARQIVMLASDEVSGHVTGQVVTVAGGMEGPRRTRRASGEVEPPLAPPLGNGDSCGPRAAPREVGARQAR